jgi:RND family efflux transporter MFP subunit
MKKLCTVLFIFALIACGNKNEIPSVNEVIKKGDLEAIKAKRDEILKSYEQTSQDLSKLEAAIAAKDPDKRLPLITTYSVSTAPFVHTIDIQGDVATKQNLLIFPEYSGVLHQVYVKEGQQVKKGQLLALIDDGGLSSQLAQLNTQLNLAKTTFERQERLWNQKIGSEIQYLQAKANYESQQNAVNQLKSQLAKTRVKAPFSGTIDEVIAEQGSVVSPGTGGLMRIVNLSNMYVKANVPENYLGTIKKNAEVRVTLPSLGIEIKGRVRQISDYIDPNNRTFSVEIALPNKEKNIKPNLIARLSISNYVEADAIVVPNTIIQENAKGEKFIFKVKVSKEDQATVEKVQVMTGLSKGNVIEITNGLQAGDVIVKDGAITLRDGITVKIK